MFIYERELILFLIIMYWDTAAFRDRFKNDYEGKGNKFISDLRQNNQEIFSKITV